MTLATLAKYEQLRTQYGKLEQLAKGTQSSDDATRREAESAAKRARAVLEQVEELERENPEIRAMFAKVSRVVAGGPEIEPPGGSLGGAFAGTVFGAFERHLREGLREGADRFAAGVAGELSGAGRMSDLRRGQFSLRTHECTSGQVCVEVRARVDDVFSDRRRATLLDAVEVELLSTAQKAGT